jgi:hypothetical protein
MLRTKDLSDFDAGDERSLHGNLTGGNLLSASEENEDHRYYQEQKFHG